MTMMNQRTAVPTVCQVCTQHPPKYRCPKCRIRYCSVACFQQHKNADDQCGEDMKKSESNSSGSIQPELLNASNPISAAGTVRKPYLSQITKENEDDEEDESWRLTEDHQLKIMNSESIKHALRDPELQKLLLKIDSAANRPEALHEAMSNDKRFSEFTTSILLTSGLYEKQESGEIFFSS